MSEVVELKEIAQRVSEQRSEYMRLMWTQYTSGFDFGVDEGFRRLTELHKNKAYYDTICEQLNRSTKDGDRRKAEILYKEFQPYHLSEELNKIETEIQRKTNELSKILNTHRTVLEDREVSSVELTQILYNDEDRDRRKKAYMARCQVNKALVDGGFIELLKLRKEYARLSGDKDFVSSKLKIQELDASLFDNWAEDLHSVLPSANEIRSRYARKYLNDDIIMPWDELYISTKIAPALTTRVDMSDYYKKISEFFKIFGIDIAKYNITYDIYPRSNKSEWGYNFTIKGGTDSRILANVKNQYHEYGVLLHETGHAIHSFNMNPEEEILNMGVSGIISEGIANLFGSFIYDESFFSKFFNAADVSEEFKNIREFRRVNALFSIQRILFDHALYRNNIESLDDIYGVYWNTYSDLLRQEPFAEEAPWGYQIHFTTHPIYLHNYFMGDVTCEMLGKVFKEKHNVSSIVEKPREFGEFLINEVIKVSGRYKYQELFRKLSGEDFSLKYLMD